MSVKNRFAVRAISTALLLLATGTLFTAFTAAAQTPRRLWNTVLVEAKQSGGAAASAKASAATKQTKSAPNTQAAEPPAPPRYTANAAAPSPLKASDALVGITIWRLREASAEDSATLTVRSEGAAVKVTPERVGSDDVMREGDRVRLTIEAPRKGYLYVIDREQYADGSTGDAYLIFPTLRIAGGDNQVEAGRLIEIPDRGDRPPYFTLRRSKPNQTAELISVIVSREPLPGVPIGAEASRSMLKLSREQVERWEADYAAKPEIFELAGGAGRRWTAAEQQAGTRARLLVQEDAMPQTLYRVPVEPGKPIMIQVPLTIVE